MPINQPIPLWEIYRIDTCIYKDAHSMFYSLAPGFWVNVEWRSENTNAY